MHTIMDNLILGDCLEKMRDIADSSIDLILCDLPYGLTSCKWDSVIPFEPLWEQYKRIIKPNGAIVLTACQPFTSALIMSNPKWFKYCWVWDKKRGVSFANAKKQPMRSHEDICLFYKNQCVYNPQYWYSTPYKTSKGKRKQTIPIIGDTPAGNIRTETINKDGKRYPLSIVEFSRDSEKIHPTQKPVALFEYLIKTYTNEGDLVLDNCIGSGTTAIAAINTNRRWIGIEKDQTYYEKALARITAHLELLNSERSA